MANLEDLEKRIRVLEDIEAIRKLKAKYFRSIDRKQWDGMAECFTKDAGARYSTGPEWRGAEAIVQHIKEREGGDHIITAHRGHNAQIEVTSDTTAKGIWDFNIYRADMKEKISRRAGSFYEEDYVKEDGEWKIKYLRYILVYSEESRQAFSFNMTGSGETKWLTTLLKME